MAELRKADSFERGSANATRRVRHAALIAGVSAYALMTGLAIGDPAANAPNFTQSTAGAISTTVPDGVCGLRATVTGGSGASSGTSSVITGGRGAGGAIIGATFRVLPGQAVTGAVAGGGTVSLASGGTSFGGSGTAAGGNAGTVTGSPWHRGGGGGGSSSISVAGVKLVEAGGGGGGGGAHQNTPTGNGGSGGFSGIGAGTIAAGVNGTAGFQSGAVTIGGGQGGQAAAGGTGGVHSTTAARNGSAGSGVGVGTGGAGGPDNGVDSGGGGGGGYTGGGGGSSTQTDAVTGGGGGGGASFVRATSPTVSATAPTAISGSGAAQTGVGAVNGSAGAVTIDWVPCVYQLNVTKSASPSPVNAGARTVWTVAVTNTGADPMTKGDTVTLTDTLPSGPIGSPTPTFRVLSIGTSGGSNTDMASGAMTCTGVTVGSSMPSSTVCSRPYSAPSAPGAPGGGPAETRGLNNGETLTITYEQIFANATAAATITNSASTVDRSSTSGTTDIIGVNATRTANTSLTVTPYNLAVTKTPSAATANPGDTLTWTVQVTNNGPGNMEGPDETAANPLIVTETPPPANVSALSLTGSSGAAGACTYASPTVTCPAGLPAGQTQTLTFQQTVNAGVAGGTTITNGAAVTDFVTSDTNDSASATVTVNPTADLAVTKSDGVASVNAGGTTSYTVTVTNNGPTSVTGATLTDAAVAGLSKTSVSCSGTPGQCTAGTTPTIAQLQAGYALPALASGQTYQLTVAANVTATSGSVANVATIAPPSGTTDPTGGNDTATDTDSVTPVADLAITKTNGASSVSAGGSTNYTITVTNNGPSAVTGATITDAAAAGLTKTAVACSGTPGQCTGGTTPSIAQLEAGYALPALASGQTYQIIVSANVTAVGGSVANTATIAPPSGTTDSTPGNDSATDTDTVNPAADLAITKTNGVASVNAGGTTSYTVTITNNGPSAATGATLTDAAVAGLSKTSVACSGTPGQCTGGTTPSVAQLEAGYALPALASGQTYQIVVGANVTAASGSVANTATIAPPSGTTDTSSGNDTATDTDTVIEVANLVTVKTLTSGNATPSAGDTVTFQIAVTNNGPSGATNVTLTDTLPAGLTAAGGNGTASQGIYTPGTGVWAVGALANGATATLTLAGTVNAGQGGNTINNTTTAASTPDQTDPTTSGDDLSETVNVFLPVIDAVDDAGTVANGASGGVAVANVLVNDTLNGVPATLATITLTQVSTTSPNVTLNPATGAVSVAAGTAAGTYTVTYQICEQLNPTNCDTATVTVTVGAAPIDAVDDDYSASPVNGASGGSTVSVLANDTLNGAAVTVGVGGNSTLTPGAAPTPAAGSITMNADGTITVAAGTTAGTYSYPYTICEVLNPTNCDTATATVVVSAAPIDAVNDAGTVANGANGGVAVANVLVNDTLNGVPATLATITLSQVSTTNPSVTLNPATGAVSVAAATPAGTYTVTYQICEQLNPTNCDTATVTVTVGAAPIDAVDDDYSASPINGASGGSTASVLANDTLNGGAVTVGVGGNSTLTPGAAPTPAAGSLTMNADGTITVAVGTTAGTYSYPYTICELLNPTNCDTATATVVVSAAPIVATADSGTVANGANGGVAVANVLVNDTLNGVPATLATVTLSQVSTTNPNVTLNPATGEVNVAPGTPAGTYTVTYQICEQLNPSNCSTTTVTVTVGAAVIDAVNDDYSASPINGANGGSTASVLANDTLNGAAVTVGAGGNSTLTPGAAPTPAAGSITMNADGTITVAAGTTAGTYSYPYTICEVLNPTNCDTATATVAVSAAPIVATNDTPAAVTNGIGSANLINAFANDTLNGAPVNVSAITASVTVPASNPGVALDPLTGIVSVAPSVPAGDYTIQYQICELINPTNCSSGTISVHVDPAVSALSGTVYSDVNGNGTLDSGEPRRANWIVEVYRSGLLVQTTNTDSQGDYQFTGLLSGPGYSIRFVNPENNVVYNVIDNLTLPDNATLADQNQPIDPSGVVYDSVSRLPVAGAIVTMVDAGGTALPGACFVSATQQGQTTGASGQYQFDIVPGAAAQCPVGETLYRLVVTPPGGYSAPSTVLAPLAGPFDPTGLPSPVAIGANGNPPAVGDATPYYFTFRLASGDAHVIFNHIPVDPFLTRTPLVVTKTSIKRTASVGDLVPYTVTVRNTEAAQRAGVNVVDILPPGFKYVPGSALVNGVAAEPVVADRELTWTNQVIPANGANVYKLTLVVGAGVTGGDRINTGLARNGADNSEISNRGQAVVSIVASTVFDCSEIIGKVFDDRDGDGYQDEGEPGIAAARLATVNGLLATTDEFGRYHITCVAVPNAFIGSNFVLKLDPRSVPAGFAPTSDNPQSIRLTRGKTSELNFGVKRAEVRQVNLDGRAFDGNELKAEFASKLGLLVPANGQAVVIRVTYRLSASEDAAVAEVRAGNVKSLIEAAFAAHPDKAAPEIETNVIRADGAQRGE